MPPMSVADYAAIDFGVPAPPFVCRSSDPTFFELGRPDMDAYREKRGALAAAIVAI